MPRNGSGVYSKPAGTTAVTQTTITSTAYNAFVDDVVSALNDDWTTGVAGIPISGTPTDGQTLVYNLGNAQFEFGDGGSGVGVTDGDKGDITVSNTGATWTIDGKTGADSGIVTGTAGGGSRIGMWNSDGDLVEATATGGDSLPTFTPSGTGLLNAADITIGAKLQRLDGLELSAAAPDLSISYTETSGTGSHATSSTTWNKVVLNTVDRNEVSSSLTSGEFTLPAGTYYARWDVTFYTTNGYHTRLYNVTDSAVVAYGLSGYAASTGALTLVSPGEATFTIDAEKTFRVEAYTAVGGASNTLGYFAGAGVNEIFARISVWPAGVSAGSSGSGGINSVLEDTSPQLGGDLDTNGRNIIIDGGRGINDELGNEVVRISRDAAAVNYLQIVTTNTGGAPKIDAVGDDVDIGLQFRTKGTGQVFINSDRALTTADEGTGNGLDADTVDGMEASAFAAAAHTHSASDIASGVLAIANGGLGVALSDPDADRLLFWDDSAGAYAYLTVGTGLSISGTTITATGGGGGGNAWADAVDADIVPDADGTRDLGATGTRFAETFTDALSVTNNIVVGGTVDGRDLAADGTKLDGIEAAADVTDAANVAAAGAAMAANNLSDVTAVTAFGNIKQDATPTATGVVELATTAEIDTGDDTARAITPKGLADSNFGERGVVVAVVEAATDVATGDGQAYVTIPTFMAGMNLVAARADVVTAGTTGNTTIQVRNVTQAADMLSGAITIASGATASSSVTIDTSNDDVAAGDRLRIDVDSVSTAAPQGLTVTLEFRLP